MKRDGQHQRRALMFKEERTDVVDHRADRAAARDLGPRDMDVFAMPGELVRTLEAELDRQSGDQRAGRKGQDAGEETAGEIEVEAQCRADQHRARGEQAEQADLDGIQQTDGYSNFPQGGSRPPIAR